MSLKTTITDGTGSSNEATVVQDHALLVQGLQYPHSTKDRKIIFRQYLTDNGLSTGSNNMLVDGSVTPVEFYVSAHPTRDRYITSLSILIADGGATLRFFGNIGVLTNGCRLHYETPQETVVLHDDLTTNFRFARLCVGSDRGGSGTNAWRANNVSGISEGYVFELDFLKFLPPYGLQLYKGTSNRLVLTVRDNLTVPDEFNIIAYGFDRT